MSDPSQEQGQQRQYDDLRSKCLCSCHSNFRSSMHIDAAVAFSSDGATDVIANSQRAMPFTLALASPGKGIDGFAALANCKDKRIFVHRHVAIPKLAGELHLGWQMRQAFDQTFANFRSVK